MKTPHVHERSILTEAAFTLTNEAGEQVEVHREMMIWRNVGGELFVAVTEPDPAEPEGNVLSAASIPVPDAVAGVFDELFALITDPATGGVKA